MYTYGLFLSSLDLVVGKKIRWHAPAYWVNRSDGYGGICIIKEYNTSQRKPITHVETIDGDSIEYAFINQHETDPNFADLLCYTDGERFVTYEILDESEN